MLRLEKQQGTLCGGAAKVGQQGGIHQVGGADLLDSQVKVMRLQGIKKNKGTWN